MITLARTPLADRRSLRRTASLTRWNVVLLARNRLALFYAVVLPLLPLALLFSGDRGDESVGAGAVSTAFVTIVLFPVYYNVLSQFVNRRDELVLKRMRTGETRDGELLASIALPGAMSALILSAVAIPVTAALGQPLPINPLLYAALAALAVTMFRADQPAAHPPVRRRAADEHRPRHARPAARDPVAHARSGDLRPGQERLVRARRPGRRGDDADPRRDVGKRPARCS